jgi:prepilin-type N-terminal cleavage/methylation domain-containing protein
LKISGFSLIEVLVALILLSLGIGFTSQWLVQSSQLYLIASQYTQLSLLAANIADSISINGSSADLKAYWDIQLKKIHKDAHLSISNNGISTNIIIETPHPNMKRLKWEVVSG